MTVGGQLTLLLDRPATLAGQVHRQLIDVRSPLYGSRWGAYCLDDSPIKYACDRFTGTTAQELPMQL